MAKESLVTMELRGLDGALDALRALPKELASTRGGPVRTGLRKGAVLILKRLEANLGAVVSNQTKADSKASTGLLQKSLTVSRGKYLPGGAKGERFFVRIKRKGYPGRDVSTLKSANLLEFGSSQQPAEPWMRPAFAATATEAIRVIESEIMAAIRRANRKAAGAKK